MANKFLGIGLALGKHFSKYFVAVEEEEQFKPRVGEGTGLHINEKDELAIQLSQQEGNLLQIVKDGLYYGIKPPANLAHLYVDSQNGVDQHPDDVEGAGTRANPLKTFRYANEIAVIGTTRSIRLKAGQRHICDASDIFTIKPGNVSVSPYGEGWEAKYNQLGQDWNEALKVNVEENNAPILALTGLSTGYYPPATKASTVPNLNCFRLDSNCILQLSGLIIENNLEITIHKHPEATTSQYRKGTISRIVVGDGSAVWVNRSRLQSTGMYQVGNDLTDISQADMVTTISGTQVSKAGFFEPRAGTFRFIRCMMQQNMSCMVLADKGWGESLNASVTYSLADLPEDVRRAFAARAYGAKIDTQNGVKILLAPRSDVSATLFT